MRIKEIKVSRHEDGTPRFKTYQQAQPFIPNDEAPHAPDRGGKTIRMYSVRVPTTNPKNVRFKSYPLEPRLTESRQILFDVTDHQNQVHKGLTKRQVKTMFGARQARKGLKTLAPEDKATVKSYRRQVLDARSGISE